MEVDGQPVDVRAAKQRTVLAVLIARRNTLVRVERLVEEVWSATPPDSAIANVRTYVSALRRLLGPYRDRLTTRAGAYALAVGDDELDAVEFTHTVDRARGAMAAGTVAVALHHHAAAERLWRGEALQDAPPGPILRSYVAALSESRTSAAEAHLDARCRAGDISAAIAGLRHLVADHPTRESAWCQLIATVYQAGDRGAALEMYQHARRSLADLLGLDPGPDLRALHAEILRGARLGRGDGAPAAATAGVPRQLPPAPTVLVARDTELARVDAVLTGPHRGMGTPGTPRMVGIHGLGGTGKSTLAVAAAHAAAAAYPDGQLYVDMQGTSPGLRPLEPVEVLARFLRALATPAERISPDEGEAAAWFRSVTADRRVLVVLDNVVDAAQVRPLLPSGSGCGVVVTSRRELSTMDGLAQVRLRELSTDAAVTVLRQVAGTARIAADPGAAREIAQLCGNLPLAVRVMAIRLARHPDWPLADVAARLRDARSRLDELGLADLDVRSTFEVGYRALGRSGPSGESAALLFRRLGVLASAEFTAGVAAALVDVAEHEVPRILDVLLDHGLVELAGVGYRIHDLLRLLAVELAASDVTAAEAEAALRRVTDSYIEVITNSQVLHRRPGGASGDAPPARTGDLTVDWFARHLVPLGALAHQLSASPRTVRWAYELLQPLSRPLVVWHPSACVRLYRPVLAEAERSGDADLTALVLCRLFGAYQTLQRRADAAACAERARQVLPDVADRVLKARVLAINGTAHVRTGRPDVALTYFSAALVLFAQLGQQVPLAVCLNNAAEATFMLGRYDETVAMLRRSLALRRRHDDRNNLGAVLDSLAMVYVRMGRMAAAARHASTAVALSERAGHEFTHASALQWRSLAYQAMGRTGDAIADAEAAVVVAAGAGNPSMHCDALRNRAAVLWVSGDPRAAAALAAADAFAATRA